MPNPDGHSPKYWKKHPDKLGRSPDTRIAGVQKQAPPTFLDNLLHWGFAQVGIPLLSGIIGTVMLTVHRFVAAEICFAMAGVWGILCLCRATLNGFPTHTAKLITRILGTLIIAALVTWIVVVLEAARNNVVAALAPDLEWRSLSVTAAVGKNVKINYGGKTDDDLLLMFEGAVVNKGGPTTTHLWNAKFVAPRDTIDQIGELLTIDDSAQTITVRSPNGMNAVDMPFLGSWLPEITSTIPLPQGSSKTGFVMFIFHGVKKSLMNGNAMNGAMVTLSFYDNVEKQTVYQWLLPDQGDEWKNDLSSEISPGMPRIH